MSNYWKDLLPVDPYVVKSSGLLGGLGPANCHAIVSAFNRLFFVQLVSHAVGRAGAKQSLGKKLDSQTADGGDADQPEDDSLRKGKA